jgi:hypothetical protein
MCLKLSNTRGTSSARGKKFAAVGRAQGKILLTEVGPAVLKNPEGCMHSGAPEGRWTAPIDSAAACISGPAFLAVDL